MHQAKPPAQARLPWKTLHLVALASLAALALALAARLVVGLPLAASRLPFKYPSSAVAGPDGLLLVTDSGDRRVLGLEPDGRLRFAIQGGRRVAGFYSGRAVGFDTKGNFYLDDSILDPKTASTEREVVWSYSPNGRRLGRSTERVFTAEERADVTSRLIYVQAEPGFLSWFYPDSSGSWLLHVLPEGEAERTPRGFGGYDVYGTVDIAVSGGDKAYFLERSGRILVGKGEGEPEAWFENPDGAIRFPVALQAGPSGELYVLDGKLRVFRLTEAGGAATAVPVLDRDILKASGYSRPLALASVAVGQDGSLLCVNEATGELLSLAPDGKLSILEAARLTGRFAFYRLVVLFGFALSALGLAFAVAAFYAKIFGSKARLLVKQLSILVPLVAFAVFGIAWTVYAGMDARLESNLADQLRHLARLAAGRLPPRALDALDLEDGRLEDILGSDDYLALSGVFDEVVNRNEDPWNANLFPYAYVRRGGDWYVVGGFDYVELYPAAHYKPEFSRVLDSGESVFYRYEDSYGLWLSALVPLRREDGSVAAVVEAAMGGDLVAELERATIMRISLGTLGLLALLGLFFAAFDAFLLRSVRALKDGAERVSSGQYDTEVDIRSRDELEELGDAFNFMSRRIKGYVEELARLGRANARFVPREFLSQLGRKSITEVSLGDQVLTEMTVLFSDIRSFTSISEAMGPRETMELLNRYLARMGPAVRAAGGFIDKYVGDSIMALFPFRPDDAVDAVSAMMAELDAFCAEVGGCGGKALDAGFGLHAGQLMLGVIGERERYESTVIADAVNLASRLESLTKFYGVRAILSGAVLSSLEEPDRPLRFLDLVRVKGKTEPVEIYELVGPGDPAGPAKLSGAQDYRRGFDLYRSGDFGAASATFAALAEATPQDGAARLMLERSRRLAAQGAPAGWEGITEFHEK